MLWASVWALIGKVASGLLTIAVAALLSRLLTPSDLGAYFLMFSVVALSAIIGKFGLDQVALKGVAKYLAENKQADIKALLRFVLSWSAITAIGVSAIYVLIGDDIVEHLFDVKHSVLLVALLAAWILMLVMHGVLTETLRGFHAIGAASLTAALIPAFTWVFLVILFYTQQIAPLEVVLILTVAAVFGAVVVAGTLVYKQANKLAVGGSALSVDQKKQIMTPALAFLITNIMLFAVTQADIWILGIFESQEEVAVYGAASRLALTTMMITSLLYAVLPSRVVEYYSRNRRSELEQLLKKSAGFATVAALPIMMIFLIFPVFVLSIVYGSYYEKGADILMILTFAQFVHVVTGMRGYVLMLTGHERLQMKISVLGGVLNILFCIIGVTWGGALGVAIGAASALVIQCMLELIAVRRNIGLWTYSSFNFYSDIAPFVASVMKWR